MKTFLFNEVTCLLPINGVILCRDSATSTAKFTFVVVLKGPPTFGDAENANLCAGRLHHLLKLIIIGMSNINGWLMMRSF